MQKNICNICGGNYVNKNGRWVCECCGAYAPEEISNEELDLLYYAGQKLRLANFDEAEELYADISREYPKNADAYWGILLSQYGIKYERDYDGKMIPTCFATSYKSFTDNSNYKKALELADNKQKEYFIKQANLIETVRKSWVEIASKEKPYDIFLSYKESEIDDPNKKTEDYFDAHEIYNELTKLGYRVFFSKEALSDKTGEQYEPYIFNALNTVKIMIVYASKPEYVNTTWIRNEWSRYYKKIKNKEKIENSLILVYKNFNSNVDLMRPLSSTQNIDRDDLYFISKLETYINRIMLEANNKTPKLDRIIIKHSPRNSTTKIDAIKKKTIGTTVLENSITINKPLTREIGTYSPVKLTPKAEDELNLGFLYLKKQMYDDALKIFNKLLIDNSKNERALLGKFLSITKTPNLDLIRKHTLFNLNDFSLLKNLINYSDKKTSTLLIENSVEAIITAITKNDLLFAYNLYSQINEYNLPVIQDNQSAILDLLLTKFDDSNEWYKFTTSVLSFISNEENEYIEKITKVCVILFKNSKFENVKSYIELLKPYYQTTIYYYKFELMLQNKSTNWNICKQCIVNNNNFGLFIEAIDHLDIKCANEFINSFFTNFNDNFCKYEPNNLASFLKIILQYEFNGSDLLIEEITRVVINNACEKNNVIVNVLLEINPIEYSHLCNQYAYAILEKGDFLFSKIYFNKSITKATNNDELLNSYLGLVCVSCGAINPNDLTFKFDLFREFDLLIKLFELCENKELLYEKIKKFTDVCIKTVKNKYKNCNSRLFETFEKICSYYPESENDRLVHTLISMAKTCLQYGLFTYSEKYYSMITGIDNSDYESYWGVLLSKLKCENDIKAIHQYTPLIDMPEYNQAIVAAGRRNDIIEYYIECRTKQEKWIKSQNKKAKIGKIFIWISSVLVAILIICLSGFALNENIIQPNKKYNNAISLINNGKYRDAIDQLEGFDYKDSNKQIIIAYAGLYFDNGSYESGIDYFYKAGGEVKVKYDANGGTVSKDYEIIKGAQNYINNDPTLIGNYFYGWRLEDYKINTSYNSYKADLLLKASWRLINYTISYNLDGGTLLDMQTSYNILSETFLLGEPAKKGYTFTGWTGTDTPTLTKEVIIRKGSTGDRRYYAHFEANEYKVTYDYGYDNLTSSDIATFDSNFDVETPTNNRNGYDFEGWALNGKDYNGGIWDITSDVRLVAKRKAKTYNISYDLNGGHNSPSNLFQ